MIKHENLSSREKAKLLTSAAKAQGRKPDDITAAVGRILRTARMKILPPFTASNSILPVIVLQNLRRISPATAASPTGGVCLPTGLRRRARCTARLGLPAPSLLPTPATPVAGGPHFRLPTPAAYQGGPAFLRLRPPDRSRSPPALPHVGHLHPDCRRLAVFDEIPTRHPIRPSFRHASKLAARSTSRPGPISPN
jgi:hypothetical protein